MILLLAVAAGLVVIGVRAYQRGTPLALPTLQGAWLVPVAFAPQWLVFSPGVLVLSQTLLLLFAWRNRRQAGFWGLGIGLALNLLVIVLNGGLMAVSPHTAVQLVPGSSLDSWTAGEPFGSNKSVILPVEQTRLWWLSDHLLLPAWVPYRAALSIGDFLIAAGAFWLLWTLGPSSPSNKDQRV
jgi:hypothetical protein